jgi:hypothetical protein
LRRRRRKQQAVNTSFVIVEVVTRSIDRAN